MSTPPQEFPAQVSTALNAPHFAPAKGEEKNQNPANSSNKFPHHLSSPPEIRKLSFAR
jgi:hypothetical protein